MDTTNSNAFDLSGLDLADSAIFTVQHPDGEEFIGADGVNPVTVEFYGPGTPQSVKALHKAGLKVALAMRASLFGKVDKDAAKQADEDDIAKVVAHVKQINNAGAITALELFGKPSRIHVRQDALKFLSNHANFKRGSTVTSPSTSDN
jgi:hypothetical protein